MAERNNNGLLSQGTGLDPFRLQAKRAYEQGGLLNFIGQGAEGLYELGRGATTIFGNQVRNMLYGDQAVDRVVPSAENSALAQAILDYSAERQGRPSTLARRDVPPPPGFVPTGGPDVQSLPVEQRIAIEDAERAELTRRGQVVTPRSPIDMTGGMTGAEAYRQGAAQDRAMDAEAFRDEQARLVQAGALKQKMDQANATGTPSVMPYVEAGTDQAQNARERSFLERMAQSGLLSTLQGMARAERQYGVGPLAAFSESALDVQAARSAAEQEAAKRQSEGADRQAKILAEQIKQSGPKEFKGPMIKSIEKASATKQSLDSINTYLELLSNKSIGGVGAKLEEGVNAIGALFGAGGESGAATARSIKSQIITGLQMGVSQGQISQGDYDQLNNILAADGWFVSNPKVEAQLQRLKGVLGGNLRTTTKILEAQGIDPSRFSPDAPSGLVSARRPAQ
jgi:hypothetical protein